MARIFVTRRIPQGGITLLSNLGHEVTVSSKDGVLTSEELIAELSRQPYDAVISLLTDKINAAVFDAAPSVKIFANYAVGYDNIDLSEAKKRGVLITNTPGVLTNSVAEHAISLMLAAAHRIPESDAFTRAGKYDGWAPLLLLGTDMSEKTLGIVGLGRIGARVAHMASRGFGMKLAYYDVARNEAFESDYGAIYHASVDELLPLADFVSVHVPLLDATRHLINKERLSIMKRSAILVNTSRGPIIDEVALVEALKSGMIRAAALDVFEREPSLAPGLSDLWNVVLTPHIASATEETREKMSEVAATNIIEALDGKTPPNLL